MSDEGMPLSERQQEAALAMADLWPGKDRDEVLATYFDLSRSPAAARRKSEWADRDAERIVIDGQIDPVLAETRELMLPALLAIEGKFAQIPRQFPSVFRRSLSKVDLEQTVEMQYTGFAQCRNPRSPSVHDSEAPQERYVYNLEHNHIGLSVRIKRAAIEDGSCWAELLPCGHGLAESFVQTEEILHANVLNTGDVFQASVMGDGVPLFSDRHPWRHGVYSNVCHFELNEMALEDVGVKIRELTDSAGLRMRARPVKLIVPIALELRAARLFHDNPVLSEKYPEGYQVLDFLTHPKNWFVQTNVSGLLSMSRHPFKLDFIIDGNDLLLDGTQSYGCGFNNPRAVFASIPKEAA